MAEIPVLFVLLCSILGNSFAAEVRPLDCWSNDDCSGGNVCIEMNCQDPCLGTCGVNTICHLVHETAMCSCFSGYVGHPFEGCQPEQGVAECQRDSDCPQDKICTRRCVDPCKETCGPNTDCKVVKHRPICSCREGYVWSPFFGCRFQKIKECTTDLDCPSDRTCNDETCLDPCRTVCGTNALCNVTNHHTACACKPGFVGNPFQECVAQSPIRDGTSARLSNVHGTASRSTLSVN